MLPFAIVDKCYVRRIGRQPGEVNGGGFHLLAHALFVKNFGRILTMVHVCVFRAEKPIRRQRYGEFARLPKISWKMFGSNEKIAYLCSRNPKRNEQRRGATREE